MPNFIKIDVEGFEKKVIDGLQETLSNKSCKVILVEIHFSILNSMGEDDTPNYIYNRLKQHGFKNLRWIDYSHLLATKY